MGTRHLFAKKVEVWTLPSNNIDTKNFSRLLEILWNDDSNNSIWRLNNSSPDKIQELWIGHFILKWQLWKHTLCYSTAPEFCIWLPNTIGHRYFPKQAFFLPEIKERGIYVNSIFQVLFWISSFVCNWMSYHRETFLPISEHWDFHLISSVF